MNDFGIDVEYFWRKVVAWANDEAVLRGREVPHREMLAMWRRYIRP